MENEVVPYGDEAQAPAPPQGKDAIPKPANQFDMPSMLNTVGTLETTDEQEKILFAPVKDEEVEIRPDGLIYLPWLFYHMRLRKAFGLQWGLIPNGDPKLLQGEGDRNSDLVTWGFYLVVKGVLMGYAIGENSYSKGNKKMSYTDAIEGAKSNALMRLCKGMGISLELWDPTYVRAWKKRYAVKGNDGNWHKRDDVGPEEQRKREERGKQIKEQIEVLISKPVFPEEKRTKIREYIAHPEANLEASLKRAREILREAEEAAKDFQTEGDVTLDDSESQLPLEEAPAPGHMATPEFEDDNFDPFEGAENPYTQGGEK